ncbi:MAG TPA: hypothetical protein VHV83_13325, partial [Armatimonadota bacterium]|nr:hypothetical protein [Armatimonadota bacterium]
PTEQTKSASLKITQDENLLAAQDTPLEEDPTGSGIRNQDRDKFDRGFLPSPWLWYAIQRGQHWAVGRDRQHQ